MKLIVGLGNPGIQYAKTRHNIGFMVVDALAASHNATWKNEPKLKAHTATLELEGERVVLAKPQTMMNLSGEAVQRLMQHYKLSPGDVWVVFDDVDTPFSRLRVRTGGGSSGHQGIKSLIESVGGNFVRVKTGISLNDRSVEPSEVYVLRPFNESEQNDLPMVIENAAGIIKRQLELEQPEESTFDLVGNS